MLEYKAAWYGRNAGRCRPLVPLLQAVLGLRHARKTTMPLNVRTWTCACGAIHDRDVNAAKNILAAGLAESETPVELV